MPLFDTSSGILNAGLGLSLKHGMPLHVVSNFGVRFVREIEIKTGWAYRTTDSFQLDKHKVHYALGFKQDQLQQVAFSFVDLAEKDIFAQREEQDHFLRTELGEPTRKTVASTIYDFDWGTISSNADPKGGSASILLRWK